MNDRRKHILYVIHRFWPHPGGSEQLVYEFARRSVRDGFCVTVFTTDAWDPESFHKNESKRLAAGVEIHEGMQIIRFPIRTIPLQFKVMGILSKIPISMMQWIWGYPHVFVPAYLREIFVRRPRYDLIVAGVLPFSHLLYPASWLARHYHTPLICLPLIHTGGKEKSPSNRYLTSPNIRLLKRADAILTATESENQALERLGISPDKISTVGVGIDPARLEGGLGNRFREKYQIDGPMVLQISTLTRVKGCMDLLEAMKRLWDTGHNAKLVLIGQITSDFEAYWLSQPPSVYERALLLGFVNEETKKDALAACDIFVMASNAESFGAVFLEAWLYGKPVIGADAGGIPYVIAEGQDGLLVRFGDPGALFEGIRKLLNDEGLRRSLGEKGRAKLMTCFTLDKVCERMSAASKQFLG